MAIFSTIDALDKSNDTEVKVIVTVGNQNYLSNVLFDYEGSTKTALETLQKLKVDLVIQNSVESYYTCPESFTLIHNGTILKIEDKLKFPVLGCNDLLTVIKNGFGIENDNLSFQNSIPDKLNNFLEIINTLYDRRIIFIDNGYLKIRD